MVLVNKRHRRSLLLSVFVFAGFPSLRAQNAATSHPSLLPGPKPADAPGGWKQLVGIYTREDTHEQFILLERNQQLHWLSSEGRDGEVREDKQTVWIDDGKGRQIGLAERRGNAEEVTGLSDSNEHYVRTDAGSDPAHFFHITLSKPLDQLRGMALAAKPPAEDKPFRKPELVELVTLDPGFHLDIRYAQSNNFLSTPIYTQARAFLQRPAAEALLRVLQKLRPLGYGILIHDAYRPWYVTKLFWDATPPEDHNFVADPQKGSRHNRGCAADLTLYELATGKAVEMPGLYDEMSPRSFPNFPGGTSLQRWHRELLRRAMESEGFTVNVDEWWHFDYKDWEHYPILNVPFENLTRAAAAGTSGFNATGCPPGADCRQAEVFHGN